MVTTACIQCKLNHVNLDIDQREMVKFTAAMQLYYYIPLSYRDGVSSITELKTVRCKILANWTALIRSKPFSSTMYLLLIISKQKRENGIRYQTTDSETLLHKINLVSPYHGIILL